LRAIVASKRVMRGRVVRDTGDPLMPARDVFPTSPGAGTSRT
jgi:hypothetical protein